MKDGLIKVAAATPAIRVADCYFNAAGVICCAKQAAQHGAKVLVLPELCLTGYTCGDLFSQQTLLDGARDALHMVCAQTAELDMLLVAGLPVNCRGKVYNCAAVLYHGAVLGLVAKSNLPNYGEFYEQRHFASANTLADGCKAPYGMPGQENVPIGTKLLFCCERLPEFVLGVEICEDLWSVSPPSAAHAAAGATVVANLSASDETVGKDQYRRELVTGQSARLVCGYLYADAGEGESTTDMVFAAHNLIAENGVLLAQSKRFQKDRKSVV